MKRLVLLSILTLIAVANSYGQKYVKPKKAYVKYTHYPSDYTLIDNYKTYYVDYEFNNKRDLINNLDNLDGFEKLGLKEKADFILVVNLLSDEVKNYKYTKSTHKGKDGKLSYTHSFNSTKVAKFSFKVVQSNGNILAEHFGSVSKPVNSSSGVSYKSGLETYKSDLAKVTNKVFVSAFNDGMNKVKNNFCIHTQQIWGYFIGFKYKKNDYTKLNEISNQSKEIFKTKIVDSEESKNKIIEFIKIWEEELSKYEEGNKKARINNKIKAGLLYNLGLAYFTLEDYDNSIKYFEEANLIDKRITLQQGLFLRAAISNKENKK